MNHEEVAPSVAKKREAQRKPTGRMRPCAGEAHKNAHVDHCGVCLGHEWGLVPELEAIDIAAARASGLDVRAVDVTEAQLDELDAFVFDGKAIRVSVTRRYGRGNSENYIVYRFMKEGAK